MRRLRSFLEIMLLALGVANGGLRRVGPMTLQTRALRTLSRVSSQGRSGSGTLDKGGVVKLTYDLEEVVEVGLDEDGLGAFGGDGCER